MTPDDPRHGEARGYYAHVAAGEKPCGPCREALNLHRRRRGKLRTMGVPGRLPIGPKLHARLQTARNRGWTYSQIADALGVSLSCAWRYCEEGPDLTVSVPTWKKLAEFRPGTVLTYVGMIRRLQALHHMGYGCTAIARETGCNREALQETIRGRAFATMRFRKAIAETYDRLWDAPCTGSPRATTRAKNRATQMKWAGALAWDDETIDDPNAKPNGMGSEPHRHRDYLDEVAVARRISGDRNVELSQAERTEVVRKMRAAGWADRRIEEHTGIKADRYNQPAQQEVAA